MEGVLAGRKSRRGREPGSGAARTHATVLLVDDRSYDRRGIAEALVAQRIAAPTLPNATRTLALLERADERVDALLLATAMPACLDFVRAAASRRPRIRFLLIDLDRAGTSEARAHLERGGRRHRIVPPDASPEAILREVEGLLGEGAGRQAA